MEEMIVKNVDVMGDFIIAANLKIRLDLMPPIYYTDLQKGGLE